MSRFNDDFAAGSVDDLLYEMGESITRYPLGVVANAVTVTALWAEAETASQDQARGDDNVRLGTLCVSGSTTVDPRDSWLIGSEVWEVTSVASNPGGMKRIELRRRERLRTRPVGTR